MNDNEHRPVPQLSLLGQKLDAQKHAYAAFRHGRIDEALAAQQLVNQLAIELATERRDQFNRNVESSLRSHFAQHTELLALKEEPNYLHVPQNVPVVEFSTEEAH